MEECQQDRNAHVNLLVPSKMWYLHHVQDSGPHDVHSPRLGDDLRLLPLGLGQIFVMCEHAIALSVS
jgi:hypothetical protein